MTRRLTALALVLTLSLTGCCWEAEPEPDDFWGDELPPEEQETSQREPAQISDFTLPYLSGQTFDPVTCIDGVQQTVGALLYEPLFTLDNSFAPQPVLCEHSSCDAQALTWTFALRSAVFSDGTALTANDLLATYRRAAESARYGARFANVASMKAQDAHTLIVTLTRSSGSFAALTVNPHWQGSSLPLERIALAAVKDNDTALSRFASRSVHFLCLDPTGTGARTVGGAVESTDVPTAAMQYLGFNLSRTPLNDAAVRRAMSGVIDRGTLVSSLLSGHGTAAQLPIAPQDADYPKTYEYRTTAEEYAAALETAGVTAARPRSLTLLVTKENAFRCAVAESLCAQLTTAALTVTVRELPWGEYAAALEGGDFDLYLGEVRLTADWDAGALLDAGGALNYGGFASEQLSGLNDAFLLGGNASAERYVKGFAEETPFAPLLFKSKTVLTPSGLVDGMTPTASDPFYGFADWSFHLSGSES